MRDVKLVENEHYHIFNRGVDKRAIFLTKIDLDRFFESMSKFNTTEHAGHLVRRHSVTTSDDNKI